MSFNNKGGPMMIEKPLVIMFENDKQLVCHLHPADGYNHTHYGLVICDLVRHVANAFNSRFDSSRSSPGSRHRICSESQTRALAVLDAQTRRELDAAIAALPKGSP